MAGIQSTFIADFSSFNEAVDKAEVKLRTLDNGAQKVGASLSRMTEQLLGQKIVKEATLAAEAIERIGGVTKLTDDELQRMASIAAAAAEKLTALGEKVPDQIAALATHAKSATTEFEKMTATLTTMAAGFASAFITTKLVGFGEEVVKDALALRNLGLQSGIAVEDLQSFGSVVDDLGISTEELGRLMNQMAKRVAGGDATAAGALHAFGLSVEELKSQSPTALFTTLMGAIDGIADPMEKAQRAADLFGDKAGAAAVKASHGFAAAVEEARKLNTVMTTESIEAIAKTSAEWDRLWKNIKASTGNYFGELAGGINTVTDAVAKGVPKWEIFKAILSDAFGSDIFVQRASALATVLDKFNRQQDIKLPADAKPKVTVTDDARMAKILTDQTKALTEAQEKYLTQLYDIGILNAANAEVFGVNVVQMEAFRKKEDEIIQVQAIQAQQLKDLTEFERTARDTGNKKLDDQNAKMVKRIELQSDLITKIILENTLAGQALDARAAKESGYVEDPLIKAAQKRDATLEQIGRYESAFPGLDTSKSRGQANADFEDAVKNLKLASQSLVNATRPGFNAGQVPFAQLGNVTINIGAGDVGGGLPGGYSLDQLTTAIGRTLMQGSGRQFGSR